MKESFEKKVLEILDLSGLPKVVPVLREIPFPGQLGLAISNIFQIAREAYPDADKKQLQQKAREIAELIAGQLRESGGFEKVTVDKGYVNCLFKWSQYARALTSAILEHGGDWGRGNNRGSGRAMVEYSQPNTHKAFHIGHVRNVVTGVSLLNCMEYAGRDVLAANYFGDIGTHVFKSLWYLERFEGGTVNAPVEASERGAWLGNLYADAAKILQDSRDFRNEVWDCLKPLNESLAEFWRDEDLTIRLGIETLHWKIALKETDLFEGRSPREAEDLMLELKNDGITLYEFLVENGTIDKKHESRILIDGLIKKWQSVDDPDELWNREYEIEDIADRWNSGDRALHEMWAETRQWSLDDFKRIYSELDARFDVDFYESQVEAEGAKIVESLVKQGIAKVSSGAKIVEVDVQLHEKFPEEYPLKNGKIPDKYRVIVLVKSDGSSLYGSKDLALAKRKFEEFDIAESIYVVDNSQKFYFEQVFQVLRLMGFEQWKNCFHLAYELVMLPEGKMSSRKGKVILYDDVRLELFNRAFSVVNEKNPDLSDEQKREGAMAVAMGALKYGMLRVDTNKIINFDFDEILDFDGRSAPYIQYAGARADSILRKAAAEGIEIPEDVRTRDFETEPEVSELDLIKALDRFPSVVQKVASEKKPIHLASWAYELAVAFSDFYHKCPVLSAPADVMRNRLILVKATRITIKKALSLMGISSPDVM